jgi:hypothetical protein
MGATLTTINLYFEQPKKKIGKIFKHCSTTHIDEC